MPFAVSYRNCKTRVSQMLEVLEAYLLAQSRIVNVFEQIFLSYFPTGKWLKSKYNLQLPSEIKLYGFGIRIRKELTSEGQHQLQGNMFVPTIGMAATDSSAVREIRFLEWI